MDAGDRNMDYAGKLTIFFSHKRKDERMVLAIKKDLETLGAGRLTLFLSEGIPFGEEWSEEIRRALKESDWLFLLYTDPVPDWDWCLFEAGYFAAQAAQKQVGRLICLLCAGLEPPRPLRMWQAVKATENDWVNLLRQLFGDSPRTGVSPINPIFAISPNELRRTAKKIVGYVGRKPSIRHYNHFINLSFDHNQVGSLKDTGEVPEGVRVESDHETLKLFGLQPKELGFWSWSDLLGDLRAPEEIGWVKSLGIELRNAANDRNFNPCLPLFGVPKINKVYHPVIYRRDHMPDESLRFKVAFVERYAEEDPRPVGSLGTISVVMTISSKFIWGVILPLRRDLSKMLTLTPPEREVTECLEKLFLSIQKVESEGAHLGFFEPSQIISAFPEGEDREAIRRIIEGWRPIRGELTERIKLKDIGGCLSLLEKLLEMVKTFLILSTKRYQNLLEEIR